VWDAAPSETNDPNPWEQIAVRILPARRPFFTISLVAQTEGMTSRLWCRMQTEIYMARPCLAAAVGGCYYDKGCGTTFELDTSGTLTVLHSFTGKDGQGAGAALLRDSAGNLYGTSPGGGLHHKGLVYKVTPQ